MDKRFKEYDKKWLYDSKKDRLYEIVDKECVRSKFGIIEITKFSPYSTLTATYENSPYKMP